MKKTIAAATAALLLLLSSAPVTIAEVEQNGRMAPNHPWEERGNITAPTHYSILSVAEGRPHLGGTYYPMTRGLRIENYGPDTLCWQPNITSVDDLDCTSSASVLIEANRFKSFSPMAIQDFVVDSMGASSVMTFTAQY